MQRYIIIGIPRSGTTAVHLLIMGHPQVSASNDEIKVRPLFEKNISTFSYGNDTIIEKEKGLQTLFDALTTIRLDENTRAHGMKLAVIDPEDAQILVNGVRKLEGIKVIFVDRSDIVAQMGSGKYANATGRLHSWRKAKTTAKDIKIELNQKEFEIRLYNSINVVRAIKQLENEIPFFTYKYEYLKDLKYKELFDFLGIDNISPDWFNSKKVAPLPEDYVINFEEMRNLQKYYESNYEELETKVLAYKRQDEIRLKSSWYKFKQFIKALKNDN